MEDNIRMDLTEIGWEVVDWIRLGPVVGFCEHGNEPSDSIKGGEFLDYMSDYQLLKDSDARS